MARAPTRACCPVITEGAESAWENIRRVARHESTSTPTLLARCLVLLRDDDDAGVRRRGKPERASHDEHRRYREPERRLALYRGNVAIHRHRNRHDQQAARWSVNNMAGGNAAYATIASEGLYQAPNAVPSPRSVTVTATNQAVLIVPES